jgi:hypothetical protein
VSIGRLIGGTVHLYFVAYGKRWVSHAHGQQVVVATINTQHFRFGARGDEPQRLIEAHGFRVWEIHVKVDPEAARQERVVHSFSYEALAQRLSSKPLRRLHSIQDRHVFPGRNLRWPSYSSRCDKLSICESGEDTTRRLKRQLLRKNASGR